MKLHRFIVPNLNLRGRSIRIDDRAVIHQIKTVLHLKPGEGLILGDGAGHEAIAKIKNPGTGDVEIDEVAQNKNEPHLHVILYLSVLKRNNFELAVQKSVEAGVSEIVPLHTRRTVKLGVKAARLGEIVREAAEQSGRGVLPVVRSVMALAEAFRDAEKNDRNLFFDGSAKLLRERSLAGAGRVGVFIGPEGGWDADELQEAKNHGWVLASLGPLTLRAETAAIIATYHAAGYNAV